MSLKVLDLTLGHDEYRLIYTVPFETVEGVPCVVEIEKIGHIGKSRELVAGADPFVVELSDDDNLFAPTRFSTATLRIVSDTYLPKLFATNYKDVRLTFKRDGVVKWRGYLSPEVYTQDYANNLFELELECVSSMGILEHIRYEQRGVDEKLNVSLLSVISKALSHAYNDERVVYFPASWNMPFDEESIPVKMLDALQVNEQVFFDKDEAITYQEVIQEICKYFGWTCVEMDEAVHFVDAHCHDYCHYIYYPDRGLYENQLHPYDGVIGSTEHIAQKEVKSVQEIGYRGANHTLDMMAGYTKAKVKISKYGVEDAFPEEDWDELKEWYVEVDAIDEYRRTGRFIYGNHFSYYRKAWVIPKVIELFQYKRVNGGFTRDRTLYVDYIPYSDHPIPMQIKYGDGRFIYGAAMYRKAEYHPVSFPPLVTKELEYNYEYIIHVNSKVTEIDDRGGITAYVLSDAVSSAKPLLAYHGGIFTASDGAIHISLQYRLPASPTNIPLIATLRVGNKCWNGTSWVSIVDEDTYESIIGGRIRFNIEMSEGKVISNNSLVYGFGGGEGLVIPINNQISGKVELTLYDIGPLTVNDSDYREFDYAISDIKVAYLSNNNASGIGVEDERGDRVYEVNINKSYVNDYEDIELLLSSYVGDGADFGKIMYGDNYLTRGIVEYKGLLDLLPEDILLHRVATQYSSPLVKLSQMLQYSPNITPMTRLIDQVMEGKEFTIIGATIDYCAETSSIIMLENRPDISLNNEVKSYIEKK